MCVLQTKTSDSGYTVIGTSADSVLEHAELGTAVPDAEFGKVPVVPSYIYYASRSADHRHIPGTTDCGSIDLFATLLCPPPTPKRTSTLV